MGAVCSQLSRVIHLIFPRRGKANNKYPRDVQDFFAKDIFNEMDMPYTMEILMHLAGLFERHIADHIEKMGGYDELKLYTKEEVEAIEDASIAELFQVIDAYYKKRQTN